MRYFLTTAIILVIFLGGCERSDKVMPYTLDRSSLADKASETRAVPPETAAQQHLIIRTAEVSINSEDLDQDLAKIEAQTKAMDGYVAGSREYRREEIESSAELKIKVPAKRLDEFLEFLEQGFKVERLSTDSQDITEQYLDLSARLVNARREEKRLLELLEQSTGSLKDVLDVERELSRVREKVETVEGKIRFYDSKLAMSTVVVYLSMDKPISEVGESWLSRMGHEIKEVFSESISLLGSSIRTLILAAAAAIPWALLAGIFIYAFVRIRRRRNKVNDK